MNCIRMCGGCRTASLAGLALVLAACAGPQGGGGAVKPSGDTASTGVPSAAPSARRGAYYLDDGPGANPPVDLASIPDAVPRPEPLLPRTMQPYSVFGRQYTPMTQIEPFRQRGIASWYGRRYHGQPTSSGERYDMYAMTAAHPTLPIPSYVRVTNVSNGRSVVVRVNDRGPFLQDRVIDLSYTAAAKLGYVEAGSAEVDVDLVTQFAAASSASREPAPPLALTMEPVSAVAPAPAPAPAPASAPADPGEVTRLQFETIQPAADETRAEASAPPAPPPARPAAGVARGFWLQFGAYNSLANARSATAHLARRLDFLGAAFDILQEGALYKVQAGPWMRREDAVAAAARVRARTELRPFATAR